MRVFKVKPKLETKENPVTQTRAQRERNYKRKESKQKLADKMRSNPTASEKFMMETLTKFGVTGWKPQVLLLGYIVDIYFPNKRTILEVDGGIHQLTKEKDAQRDEHFWSSGFRVIRITDKRLYKNPRETVDFIKAQLRRTKKPKPPKIKRWQDVPRLGKDHLPIRSRFMKLGK